MKELWPCTGVQIRLLVLSSIVRNADKKVKRLFSSLVDHVFTAEELQNAIPFGGKGSNKSTKKLLPQNKVNAVIGM